MAGLKLQRKKNTTNMAGLKSQGKNIQPNIAGLKPSAIIQNRAYGTTGWKSSLEQVMQERSVLNCGL
jgi:hypothetical protein